MTYLDIDLNSTGSWCSFKRGGCWCFTTQESSRNSGNIIILICIIINVCDNKILWSKQEIHADTYRSEITLSSQSQKHGRETRKRNEVSIYKTNQHHLFTSFETYNVIQVPNADGNPKKEKRPKKKVMWKKSKRGRTKEIGVKIDVYDVKLGSWKKKHVITTWEDKKAGTRKPPS